MNTNNTYYAKGINWSYVLLYVLITCIGIVCIFSTEYKSGTDVLDSFFSFKTDYSKQLYFFMVCLLVGGVILLTDSRFFTEIANVSYLVGILLILATFVVGKNINGSRSWIPLGFMNLQPAELCKIFTSLALSKYLSTNDVDLKKIKNQLIAFAIAFTPAVLSILQGETGLALVYTAFLIPMYRQGLPSVYILFGLSMGTLLIVSLLFSTKILLISFAVVAALALFFYGRQRRKKRSTLYTIIGIWLFASLFVGVAVPIVFTKVLKKYQADRIFDMIGVDNPYASDTVKISGEAAEEKKKKESEKNYNVRQSKIAIGSGGFLGKGFLKGTQTQGNFVPEQHTDFIFTSLAENFGFVGCFIVLGLYLTLIIKLVLAAEKQRSIFSRVYGYCVAALLFFHVTVNVAVTMGLAPVIGITLPYMSYGGSSLLTFTVLLFIFIRLDADRQKNLR